MKIYWAIGLLLGASLTVSAPAQISFAIGINPPPPIRLEPPPPPPPVVGMVWVDGFWAPQGNHYRWVAGHYDHPPYPGAYWSHPHYDHYSNGWHYEEGHWDREDHGHGHAYGHTGDKHGHERGHD